VIWDFEQPQQKASNRSFYTKLLPAHPAAPALLEVTHLVPAAAYRLEVHRTGYRANDAYSAYLDMGAPNDLTAAQVAQLNDLTRDLPETDHIVDTDRNGKVAITIQMNSNDVVLVSLARTTAARTSHR
jgi:xylan 1,4-beta-xylosidase